MNRITWLLIALISGLLYGGTQSLLQGQAPDLENEITAGNEVSFPIKYNAVAPAGRDTTGLYHCCDMDAVAMVDGTVKLSKTTFAFTGPCTINRGFGRYDHCDFQVTPDKIIELENQPEQSSRIHVKVALKNKKGDKEDEKDYYFYNAGAEGTGDSRVGSPGASIICNGCDDSMGTLYGLLTKFRDRNWSATSAPPASVVIESALPPPPPMADIAPPPPPADAPPPTIAMGQTMDQVTTGFGQPLKVAKLGAKTIFYYKDMKVTFTNGKVSNVE